LQLTGDVRSGKRCLVPTVVGIKGPILSSAKDELLGSLDGQTRFSCILRRGSSMLEFHGMVLEALKRVLWDAEAKVKGLVACKSQS